MKSLKIDFITCCIFSELLKCNKNMQQYFIESWPNHEFVFHYVFIIEYNQRKKRYWVFVTPPS